MEAAEIMSYQPKPSATLTAVIDEYLASKRQSSWSATGSSYSGNKNTLEIFARCLKAKLGRTPRTTDITDDNIFAILNERWPNTGTTKTYKVNHARLKTFVRWLQATTYDTGIIRGFIEHKAKAPQLDVSFLSREEMELVVRTILPYAPRDARLIQLAYELSRRAGEMVKLKIGDLRLKATNDAPYGSYSYTQQKTGGDRISVRLTASQRSILNTWLLEYEGLVGESPVGHSDWYLFPATMGTGKTTPGQKRERRLIPTDYIREPSPVWRSAYKAAGVYVRGKGSHAGRRGGLTDDFNAMEEAGIPDPIAHLQRKAGHKSRQTTIAYIQMDEADRRAFDALQKIDDIRSGRTAAPEAEPETVKNDFRAESGEEMAKVIQLPFGRKRA